MKTKHKRLIAWILILVPAFYIAYHSIVNGAFTGNLKHLYVFIAVLIWLVGDTLLSYSGMKGGKRY